MNKILAGMIFGDGGGGGGGANIQPTKTATVNGTVTPDEGYDALAQVVVNVSGGITPTGTININTNGTHDVTQYASANVAVPQANIQSTKTVTQNGPVTPDVGYDALAQVIVSVSGGGGTSKFANGTVTVLDDSLDPVSIEHGLGVVPNCIFIMTNLYNSSNTTYLRGSWWFDNLLQSLNKGKMGTVLSTEFRNGSLQYSAISNVDEDYFDIVPTETFKFPPSGCTFEWLALYIDTTS